MPLVRLSLPSRTRHTLFDIRAQGCPGWGLVAGSECRPWRGMLYNPPPPSHTHPCCLRLCALLTCDDATTNKTKRQLGTRVRQHVGGLGHIKDNAPLPYYVDIPFPGAHTARVKPKRLYNWLGLALPIKRTLYLSCSGRTVLHPTSPSYISIIIILFPLPPICGPNNNLCTVYKDINLYCNCKVYANRWQAIFLSS